MLGLVIGKPLGIGVASWLAVRSGLATLSEGVSWRHLLGTAFLAGIGFTMALFISGLASRARPSIARPSLPSCRLAAGGHGRHRGPAHDSAA